jgi:hypothetical protein
VWALAVSGGALYAGGDFETAGTTTAYYIAQWDGTNWSAVGRGMDSTVRALAMSGGLLYAGGDFTTADGNTALGIAQWDGTNWLGVGEGMNGTVSALAVLGDTLYAGGDFTTAGDSAATNIAQWDGSSWSPLGSGTDGDVYALAVSGGTVFAGGYFNWAGNSVVNCIAQWDGSSWSPLGSGMSGEVYALAVADGTLYVGGQFMMAGTNVSSSAAEAAIAAPTILSPPQNTNVMAGANAGFAVVASGQQLCYQWFKNMNLLSNGGNVSGATSSSLLLTDVYVNDPGFYYVVVSNSFGSVTNSGATLTVSNLPLVLACSEANSGWANGPFWLTVAGPAGSNVVISASSNLQTWVPLATNPMPLGWLLFTDVLSTNYSQRFYRTELFP